MALEDEIYKAGNLLEGAAQVVDKGLSIFDNIAKTFYPNPVPIVSSDPAGELGGQAEIAGAKPASPTQPNVGLLIVIGVIAYIVLS